MNIATTTRVRLPRRVAGLTLIELMVVLIIVAILGVFAVPSYRQYSIRAQRTEAKSALMQLAANQERYYMQNGNSYAEELEDINMEEFTENNRYRLSITSADATGFVAEAEAQNEMEQDSEDCQVFTINALGVRTGCW